MFVECNTFCGFIGKSSMENSFPQLGKKKTDFRIAQKVNKLELNI